MARPDAGVIPPQWRWQGGPLRDDAVACFASAVAAVAPGPAVARALSLLRGRTPFTHLMALGKAAVPMAEAATRWQLAHGGGWRASLVVAPESSPSAASGLTVVYGDHPLPGLRSSAAAAALARFAERVTPDAHVLLLLSGGTTSLVAAPVEGVSLESLRSIFRTLLASGLDIHGSNCVRKRFLQWGGGRLATALAPARIQVLAISDVPGDEPATIGSGPVSPETTNAEDVAALIAARQLVLPRDAEAVLDAMRHGEHPDLPVPSDPCFARVRFRVIASNATALDAAAHSARSQGYAVETEPNGLRGEAREAGIRIAQRLHEGAPGEARALILGGETTVTLGPSPGTGGRSQELALAAARALLGSAGVVLLAGGTDGSDGNSMNAGGVVDGSTWELMGEGQARLRDHDSATALASAGATLYTGPTGTNVMDIVVALRARR